MKPSRHTSIHWRVQLQAVSGSEDIFINKTGSKSRLSKFILTLKLNYLNNLIKSQDFPPSINAAVQPTLFLFFSEVLDSYPVFDEEISF